MRKTYTGLITILKENQVFVFGSNKYGFHGGGSAGYATFNGNTDWRTAGYHLYPNGFKGCWNEKGIAEGIQHGTIGKSYAIPTVIKPNMKRSISKKDISYSIHKLYEYARYNDTIEFFVAYTSNGRNLNGYTNQEMADMFYNDGNVPENIIFEDGFNHLVFDKRESFDITEL